MIIDARKLPEDETIKSDVCIVGGGTAGITLAKEFIDRQFRVCLLESGGIKPDKETQSLYAGENIGHPYFSLDTARARYLGGTTNRWVIDDGKGSFGARMRSLDEIDFEERDWVPHSGWPFPKSHLDPYYQRAQALCRIEPSSFAVETWEQSPNSLRLPLSNGRVKTVIFKIGSRDPFIQDYIPEISKAANITTYLHANVANIETDEAVRTVKRLRVFCLPGNKFWVAARLIILAAGAIEIPRLLLLSNQMQNVGLGNQYDLVGRYFQEHLHFQLGLFVPSDSNLFLRTSMYNCIHPVNGVSVIGKMSLSERVLRREKLLNYVTQFNPTVMLTSSLGHVFYPNKNTAGARSFKAIYAAVVRGAELQDPKRHLISVLTGLDGVAATIYRALKRRAIKIFTRKKIQLFVLESMSEQLPNPQSRILLSEQRDRLGMNGVQLDWRLSPMDTESAIRSQEILDQEFKRAGLGRLYTLLDADTPPQRIRGGWHHMGTTRMHVDPRKGIVDENSRIHGISNLFIAGPSVFPTSGYANPSLTIIALAVRLADHIKQLMER
ncbi:MAG: GMC oxidoreductase [Planctomycetota bacterium]|jgi:choline dehydrogenase-like flavoprotein